MSRDISLFSSQKNVDGAFSTSIITTSDVCFDPGHKTTLSDGSNSRLVKPLPCYFGEEEAKLYAGSDGDFDISSYLEAEEPAHELQLSYTERRHDGKDASPSCHMQDLEENLIEDSSQDTPRLQLENNKSNDAVAYCVELLQHDPVLQTIVVSLASDPVVWDAFQRNEKIQELMQTRKLKQSELDASNQGGATFLQHQELHGNPFFVAFKCLRSLVWDTFNTSINVVSNTFSFIDRKIFGERTSDPLDKPFKACMVLTMLVLALVVLKKDPNKEFCNEMLEEDTENDPHGQ